MAVATGDRIGRGRFEVLGRLGEGGAGVVYAVRDCESDARLALKTVRSGGPEALVSLRREFRTVQDLAHPNVVRLDDLFEEQGVWFFTMELVEGVDWLTYTRREPGSLRETLAQLVLALGALHATGTVHRDVKPSNVLVSPRGHVKLLDFGIAARARRAAEGSSEGIVGTLAYMPPEQLLAEAPTAASDFYAVGVMLHQALTGRLPLFDGPGEAHAQKLVRAPKPVRELAPEAVADLAALCDALLQCAPQARPDAAAILRALRGDAAPRRATSPPRRRPSSAGRGSSERSGRRSTPS